MATHAKSRRKIALVGGPRLPGGSSTAVAHEICALHGHVDLRVFGVESSMFRDRPINPTLQRILDERGLELVWNPPVIRSEVVVFHNPSCLKFNEMLEL